RLSTHIPAVAYGSSQFSSCRPGERRNPRSLLTRGKPSANAVALIQRLLRPMILPLLASCLRFRRTCAPLRASREGHPSNHRSTMKFHPTIRAGAPCPVAMLRTPSPLLRLPKHKRRPSPVRTAADELLARY